MLTYEQLRAEQVWRDQVEPPELRTLRQELEKYYDPSKTNIGTYGDNRHVKGYHRSRAWILGSKYCENRTYSVTETEGNRSGGNENWISAIDITVGQARSVAIAHRLNVAKGNGALPYVRQIILERDPWHVHVSLDRAYANVRHTVLFEVITGTYAVRERLVSVNLQLPVLRDGADGGHVRTAQALLTARGFPTKMDGDFGTHTEEQTRAMQRRYGAEKVDGVWGPETWTIAVTGEDRV